ncbi:MAG: YjgP/YjgQ family permease [Deltaproteobacteria bacterium]|nr:MAG: YjgP/YjgQ family permease [Deltaproteobacteria bacterium]
MKTITRYILRELFPPTILGLFVFTVIVVGQQILKISDYIIAGGVPPAEVGKLILYSLPAFLEISIPIALILGVTVGFSRLSVDSEIIALRAAGIGIRSFVPPVFLLSLIGFLAVAYLTLIGSASGYRNLYETVRKISAYGSREIIREGVFTAISDTTLVYVDHISPDGKNLYGVVLSIKRNGEEPVIITAEKGIREKKGIEDPGTIVLENGRVNQKLPDGTQRVLSFETLTFRPWGKPAGGRITGRKPKEIPAITILTLLRERKIPPSNLPSYLFSLHKRLSLPFACLVFSFFAVPLGMAQRSRGKSGSFLVTGGIVLVYYLFIGTAQSLKGFSLPLSLSLIWAPNILFSALTWFLIGKMERDPAFNERLGKLFRRKT